MLALRSIAAPAQRQAFRAAPRAVSVSFQVCMTATTNAAAAAAAAAWDGIWRFCLPSPMLYLQSRGCVCVRQKRTLSNSYLLVLQNRFYSSRVAQFTGQKDASVSHPASHFSTKRRLRDSPQRRGVRSENHSDLVAKSCCSYYG